MEKVSRSDIKNLFEDISTGVEHLLAQFKYKEIGECNRHLEAIYRHLGV